MLDFEGDTLPLGHRVEIVIGACGHVEEVVFIPVVHCNEAEASVRDALNSSSVHCIVFRFLVGQEHLSQRPCALLSPQLPEESSKFGNFLKSG